MDPRHITDTYAVAPQISPDDAPAIRSAGYRRVINNRPDGEIGAELSAAEMRAALEAEGIEVIENPLSHGTLSMNHVDTQRTAIDEAGDGRVLAYCASGNRSTILWALSMAGRIPTEEIVARAAAAGYDLSGLTQQIDALAAR